MTARQKGYIQTINQREYHNPYSKVTQAIDYMEFEYGRNAALKKLLKRDNDPNRFLSVIHQNKEQ